MGRRFSLKLNTTHQLHFTYFISMYSFFVVMEKII